ncbi:hypothetical protein AB0M91_09355 [Micromonospora rifamycinica]|uniref:hypothetical protein n=1 Tax=Micromonospora rifamycinica TaxID=291594 RepID=UPI003420400D
MVDDVRVRLDRHEIALLGDSAEVGNLTTQVAWGLAREAQAHALRQTGRGAGSIQAWPGRDGTGPYTDVSWDQDHFYMSFAEWGTGDRPARPALRPALDRYVHL